MRNVKVSLCVAMLVLAGSLPPAGSPVLAVGRSGAATPIPFDFNADGYADLAVGAPGEKLGGSRAAGQVHVIYGSAAGPTAAGDQLWSQRSKGVPGIAEKRDRFGSALASADFNGDGFADLAVGVPYESFGSKRSCGAVNVIYGGPGGLRAAGSQLWHQDVAGVPGTNTNPNQFGTALAVGDFDGDHFADLAIGVPVDQHDAGRVIVLRGAAGGLRATGGWSLSYADPATMQGDHPMGQGHYGSALAAGDVNADGLSDLVVSAPDAGAGGVVDIRLGSPSGLVAVGASTFTAESLGIPSASGHRKVKGVAVGDFNADGRADVAIESHETTGSNGSAGSGGTVAIMYARPEGFAAPAQLWRLDGPALVGDSGWFDWFGRSLAVGDYTGDGLPDLAVGAYRGGAPVWVYLLAGGSAGLAPTQVVLSDVQFGARGPSFAGSLAARRLSGGNTDWLVIGAGSADVGSHRSAGTVTVVRFAPGGGVAAVGDLSEATRGVRGKPEQDDGFGVVDPGLYPW